jgi:hypothetical protein
MLKNKTSAILSMALVFVSGALLGGLGYRAYNSSTASSQRPLSPADWRTRNLPELRTRLRLDDQQFAKLGQIFDRFDDDFRKIGEKRRQEDQASSGSMLDKIKRAVTDDHSRIGLTEQQTDAVNKTVDRVYGDFFQLMAKRHAENQALQSSLADRINATLQPDQRALYQQYRDERQKRRQSDDSKQGRGPGGPPMGPPPAPKN